MNQPHDEEERDDAIVGKAFVWSASLIAAALIFGGGYFYWKLNQKPPKVESKIEFEKPEPRKALSVEIPEMPFTEITASAGIRFVHDAGVAVKNCFPKRWGAVVRSLIMITMAIRTFCL